MNQQRCEQCYSEIEAEDLRCVICGVVTPETEKPPRPAIEVLRCDNCGAAVSYDVKHAAPRCGFCGSTTKLEEISDPLEQTEKYLSLDVTTEDARQAFKTWLGGKGFFAPSDLLEQTKLEKIHPLWWTGWVFDAKAQVSWTADSNANARESDWAPHSGQVSYNFDNVLISASRGLSDAEVQTLAPHYRLEAIQSKNELPNDAIIEQFETQRSAARSKIIHNIQTMAEARVHQNEVPGSRVRNLHVHCCLEALSTERIAFPVYILAYRYREELYRVVLHGQKRDVIAGRMPISWAKVLLVASFVLLGLGVLGYWLSLQ